MIRTSPSSFDWNDSPLSVEAARQRSARDAAIRAQLAAAPPRSRQNDDAFCDVNIACTAWLRTRGHEHGYRNRQQINACVARSRPDSFVSQVRRFLGTVTEALTREAIAQRMGISAEDARGGISHLRVTGHAIATGPQHRRLYRISPIGRDFLNRTEHGADTTETTPPALPVRQVA